MSKYFLPPLLASFSFGLFCIPSNLMNDWDKFSQLSQLLHQIMGALVFTPFVYITVLPIHCLGCLFIRGLKIMGSYSLITLLFYGFIFGLMFGLMFDRTSYTFIITGLSGMVAGWSYYYLDKRQQINLDKEIEDNANIIED